MALDGDIYHSAEQLEKGFSTLVLRNGFRKKDIRDITNFLNDMAALGVKPIRLKKQLYVLRKLSTLQGKAYRDCSKKDLMLLVRRIDSAKNHSEWTKYDRKVVLKRFYRWLNGDEEYPKSIKWLKLKDPKNSILPEELLTEEEVIKAVDAAKYLRDKAFIYTLYESGCRIGELLTLQIKNVSFGEHVTSLVVAGKTGQRRIPLISSTSYLSIWLSMHPFKDNPDAPLWTKIVDKWHPQSMEALSYKGAQKMLRVAFRKAGIRKRPSPHLFRHSRATILAKHLTEAQLKEYFGWTQASDMAARYVHLSGRDVDTAIMKLHGIPVDEAGEEMKLRQVKCPRCREENPSNFSLCKRCGAALGVSIAMRVDENRQGLAFEFMRTLINDLQKLEGKGIDLRQISEFLGQWAGSGRQLSKENKPLKTASSGRIVAKGAG